MLQEINLNCKRRKCFKCLATRLIGISWNLPACSEIGRKFDNSFILKIVLKIFPWYGAGLVDDSATGAFCVVNLKSLRQKIFFRIMESLEIG